MAKIEGNGSKLPSTLVPYHGDLSLDSRNSLSGRRVSINPQDVWTDVRASKNIRTDVSGDMHGGRRLRTPEENVERIVQLHNDDLHGF